MCFYKNLLSYSSGIDKIRRVYSNENQGSVSKIVNFITPRQGDLVVGRGCISLTKKYITFPLTLWDGGIIVLWHGFIRHMVDYSL